VVAATVRSNYLMQRNDTPVAPVPHAICCCMYLLLYVVKKVHHAVYQVHGTAAVAG
jgi:hypothetical protein